MKTTEEKIVKLNNKAQEIINRNDLDWEQKYDKLLQWVNSQERAISKRSIQNIAKRIKTEYIR